MHTPLYQFFTCLEYILASCMNYAKQHLKIRKIIIIIILNNFDKRIYPGTKTKFFLGNYSKLQTMYTLSRLNDLMHTIKAMSI